MLRRFLLVIYRAIYQYNVVFHRLRLALHVLLRFPQMYQMHSKLSLCLVILLGNGRRFPYVQIDGKVQIHLAYLDLHPTQYPTTVGFLVEIFLRPQGFVLYRYLQYE